MRPELRARVIAYNKEVAKNKETAADLRALLEGLPAGILKQIQRTPERAAILEKYGITIKN